MMPIPTITMIYAPACHFCAGAQDALSRLAHEMPVRLELVEAGSADGMALVGEHRPTMFPLVLVDGAFFSQGRLPSRKLRALLGSAQAGSRQ